VIVALETSSPNCEITFLKEEKEILTIFADTHSKHEKNLITFFGWAFKYLKITIKEVELIGISIGPGNFTALRVGLATALGIAYPHNIPVKAINTLDALYFTSLFYFSYLKDKKILVVSDAKRESLYAALYQNEEKIGNYQLVAINKLSTIFKEEEIDFVCGNALLSYPQLFENFKKINIYYPKAKIIGLLAKKAKEAQKLDSLFSLSPFYLKEPDIRK
jgi:tRNA threonylcarbamoyladenosine biosynthesis protein TsaB